MTLTCSETKLNHTVAPLNSKGQFQTSSLDTLGNSLKLRNKQVQGV